MNAGLNALLKAVSRSFYLTIRLLPRPLGDPIGLAYLLARLSDTVADSANAPAERRLLALRALGEAVRGCAPMPDLRPFADGVADPSERRLLARAAELGHWLEAAAPADRAEIVRVLETIFSGQCLDVSRFGGGGLEALASEEELNDYTYRVAGCVGEFWTRICSRHIPRYAGAEPGWLAELGISFGQGLQLVNVLRDAPADLAQGRCYLPAAELPGGDPAMLKTEPERARPLYDRWIGVAWGHLEDGLRYIEAVRPWRLRLACFLPWALGVRTLRLLETERPLERKERVKVTRREVRRLFRLGLWGACGNGALRRVAEKIKSQKV